MAEILHQLRLVVYSTIYRVCYIPGFLQDFSHQPYEPRALNMSSADPQDPPATEALKDARDGRRSTTQSTLGFFNLITMEIERKPKTWKNNWETMEQQFGIRLEKYFFFRSRLTSLAL